MGDDLVTREVSSLYHQYATDVQVPDGKGGTLPRVVWQTASRGQEITISSEQSARGDELAAFVPLDDPVASTAVPVEAEADDAAPAKELEDMAVVKLRREAKARGVVLGSDVTTKADIIAALEAAHA